MKLSLKILILPAMILFLHSGTGYSDTVLLRNGDKLIGDVQNDYFVLQTSFGQVNIKKPFCKNIIMDDNRVTAGWLKTINNDLLSGTILNRQIKILLTDQSPEAVDMYDLKSVFFDTAGPSRQVTTTVFTTGDGGRFSGRLLTPQVRIRTNYMNAAYKAAEINRIEFDPDKPDKAALLLTKGDLIHGSLLLEKIQIVPDSFAPIAMDQSKLRSIQFNARKMLIEKYSSSAASIPDADGDEVPDDVDNCPNTPWGDRVNENGCSKDKIASKNLGKQAQANLVPQDKDGDSVIDEIDQCPQTPSGVRVDKKGCWLIGDILFDFDSDRLKSEYYPVLNEVSIMLQNNPSTKIEIQGGTDNIGPDNYNKDLSQRRAQKAKDYLVKKGIKAERILAAGYGAERNKASNENSQGRALNRRIDFLVIE